MTATDNPTPTTRDRAIADWESALVRNLNPLLTDAQSEELWVAILANRESPDADKFAAALLTIIAPSLAGSAGTASTASRTAVTQLRSILTTKAE